MSQKKHKPDEIVAKLRQVDVLVSQGRSVSEAVRAISVTPFTWPAPMRWSGMNLSASSAFPRRPW